MAGELLEYIWVLPERNYSSKHAAAFYLGVLRKSAWMLSMMKTGTRITREVLKFIVIQTRFIFQLMDPGSPLRFWNMMTLNQNQAGPDSQ